VDTSLGAQLQINMDIDFPALPCAFISVNAMDKTGNNQLNIHHNIFTTRLSPNGSVINEHSAEREIIGEDKEIPDITLATSTENECGSCYGAESTAFPCCPTCDDVQEAYRLKGWAFTIPRQIVQCIREHYMERLEAQKNEGCRVHGFLNVERVGGNVNIVPGKFIIQNSRYVVDSNMYQFDGDFNVTHKINKLSFGKEYPGMKNPLDGIKKDWKTEDGSPMYEYYVQIVPTIYKDNNELINTNQYSVTEYMEIIKLDSSGSLVGRGVPGLFFMYELSPITVDFLVSTQSFLHFLTNLCAIIGGIFTVASLFDSFVYKGLNTLQKKIELGKHM